MTTKIVIPTELHLDDYTWRPYRREDVPALYQMMLALDRAENRNMIVTPEDMEKQYDDPWCNPETDSLLAFTADGQVAAMARVFVNPEPVAEHRAHLWGEVHPDHRRDGLEDFIFTWMEARGREKLDKKPADLPRLFRVGIQDDLRDRITLLERRGFRPVRYAYRMRRDLGQPIPDEYAPEGITLRAYSPDLDRGLLQALNEAFADHWGFEPATEQDWQVFMVGRSDFRPDLTFVAMEGDAVIGLCLNVVNPESNERQGIQEGWIQTLGVRRAWRKRGVATALLCQSMRAFKAARLDYATLGVDTQNLTGALRIYERLGFVAYKRFIAFDKPVG